MQTCYCCNSVRQLSYSACVYSLIYATFQIVEFVLSSCHHSLVTMSVISRQVNGTSFSLAGDDCSRSNSSSLSSGVLILQGSVINPQGFSQTDFFYLRRAKFILDVSIIIFSLLLFWGLQKGYRQLLIPWILSNICLVITDMIEIIVLLSLKTTKFEPNTAFVFTISFFLLVLHIYAILGVIAQYQEYDHAPAFSVRPNNADTGGTSLIVIETDYTPTIMREIDSNAPSKLIRTGTRSNSQKGPKRVKFINQKKVFQEEEPIASTYDDSKRTPRGRISSPVRKISTARLQRQRLKLAANPSTNNTNDSHCTTLLNGTDKTIVDTIV